MNEYDGAAEHDGSLVVCKMCIRPVNTALPNNALTNFCVIVGLGEKKKKGKWVTLCCKPGNKCVSL